MSTGRCSRSPPVRNLFEYQDGLPSLMMRQSAARDGALALISGRPLAQLDRLFQPWQGAAAGLHGLERRRADGIIHCVVDGDSAAALDRLRPKLAALAADGTGLTLEDKRGTLALHYRAAPQREPEIRAVVEALHREIAALRLITGKMVVEFQPRSADKGRAIAAFLAEQPFLRRRPVFVGDDTTDEDGFAEIRRRGGVAVRVGPFDGATAANYRLPNVEAVLAWLASSDFG